MLHMAGRNSLARSKGVVFLLAALLVFACMDMTIKVLTSYYEAPVVVTFRFLIQTLLMMALFLPSQGARLVRTQSTALVVLRAASLAVASLLVAFALTQMPLAETTSIVFLAPLLVVFLARPVLGEQIGMRGWTGAVLGFAGAILIVRPGSGLDSTGIVCAVCAAACLCIYLLLSRYLAPTERTLVMLFYSALIGTGACAVLLPWYWQGEAPTLSLLVMFVLMGAASGVGHFLLTAAYRHAPASILAPLNFLQLVWAGVLGWLVFDHVPDELSILGILVIATGGIMVAVKPGWVPLRRLQQ